MKEKVVSIFSGIDLLGLGFREYFDIVLAVEQEEKACKILKHNKDKFHPNMEIVNEDIRNVSEEFISKFEGVCGIIGGPPCQEFSSAKGSFDPSNERVTMLDEYVKWVRIIKPSFFMFENTDSILNKGKKEFFFKLLSELEILGYSINWSILNSHDYGNAQNRKRAIIVGFKKDLNIDFKFPQPVDNKKFVRDILDDPNNVGECASLSPRLKEIMPYVPEGGYWRDLPSEELLRKALGKNFEKRAGGMTGVCRRLHRDKPCPTVMASGPNQNTTLLAHPIETRVLSVTEYQRAQGVPDDYEIFGSIKDKYQFIGNGVPVEMANCISKSIYESILKYEYTNKEEISSNIKNLDYNECNINSSIEDYNYNIEDITKISNDNQIMFVL